MNDTPATGTVASSAKDSTGIGGLDEILTGGFTRDRIYLAEGVPGSGKTTLGLQFALEGLRRGESVLYVSLSETLGELQEVATSHGWSLDGLAIRELAPSESSLRPDEQYTMFHPSEVELSEATRSILADVETLRPARVVFDSLSELRLLAGTSLRYRRQIMALKQAFAGRRTTVLLLDDVTNNDQDLQVQTLVHGVLRLEQLDPEYGAERRRLRVVKYRGAQFRGGYHDYVIRTGGLTVFPRLRARDHRGIPSQEKLASGVANLDALLGGGLRRGNSMLLVGAAGTGKSSVAAQFAAACAARGERAAMFIFDESPTTLLARCAGLGIDMQAHVDAGRVSVQAVDPAEMSPGEFTTAIRRAVEVHQASLVVIDSLNGYLNAMPEERFLIIQLHELLTYLGEHAVSAILVSAHQGLVGQHMVSAVDATYLADAVVLFRYFEADGQVRQAISVMKNRSGAHHRTICELTLARDGIRVGRPLADFRGILTGVPVHSGNGNGSERATK